MLCVCDFSMRSKVVVKNRRKLDNLKKNMFRSIGFEGKMKNELNYWPNIYLYKKESYFPIIQYIIFFINYIIYYRIICYLFCFFFNSKTTKSLEFEVGLTKREKEHSKKANY